MKRILIACAMWFCLCLSALCVDVEINRKLYKDARLSARDGGLYSISGSDGSSSLIRLSDLPPLSFRTQDGESFEKVRILSLDAQTVGIYGKSGAKSVSKIRLDEDWREFFGYSFSHIDKDSEKARQAEWLKDQNRKIADQHRNMMDSAAKADAERVARKEMESQISVESFTLYVRQAGPEGSICETTTKKKSGSPIPFSVLIYVPGITNEKYADDDFIDRRDYYSCGNYSYSDASGILRTVKMYATSKDSAIAILRAKKTKE